MKRVFITADPVAAGMVEALLSNAGIPCLLRNQYLAGAAGELPLNEVWPEVWVLDDGDSGVAERLIREACDGRGAGGETWTCASCGETLESQFRQCWRCGAAR